MLHEIVGLADEPPAKRRWFHDDYFDLFVWQALSGEVTQFQLCYGIHARERALVWHRQGGFFHDGPAARQSDALGTVMAHFNDAAPTLPKMIRQTVGVRLQELASHEREIPSRRGEFRRAVWQRRLAPGARKVG